jgi:hypothetical protein
MLVARSRWSAFFLLLGGACTCSAQVQAWACFGGSPQHRNLSVAKAQPLKRILWSTPVDLSPVYGLDEFLQIHYGSPVVTRANTIIVPVKTGSYDGFRVEARNGGTGAGIYWFDTDYSIATGSSWMASFGPALGKNALFVPAAGGTLMVRKDPDKPTGALTRSAFYGFEVFDKAKALYAANVKVSTPVTVDAKEVAWFGFRTYGQAEDETPIGTPNLLSGIARVDAEGRGAWRSAKSIADDPDAIRIPLQCAPAISDDGATVYFAIARRAGGGYLVGIDATTLKTKYRAPLFDPANGNAAILTNQSSASPTIGTDGDVYYGVMSNPQGAHNGRGYLLHFDKTLTTQKATGSFGWDDTPSLLPATAVPGYKGTAKYLVLSKYNNYATFGDGVNRMALLDPSGTQPDAIASVRVMAEVASVAGVTGDPQWLSPDYPFACYEWCVNAAAVDIFSRSAILSSEDGRLYRWDFTKNAITEGVLLEGPRGQAYTPTVVGPTGISYAINNAKLFAVGQ